MIRPNWPLPGDCVRVTSPYGPRAHPVTGAVGHHSGIDIACPEGTAIVAPAEGVVLATWIDERFGGGLSLTIGCGSMRYGFAHLSQVLVARGQQVGRGELIARSGGTPGTREAGRSTGPHLHLTVRHCGELRDPMTVRWIGGPEVAP